MKEVLLRKPRVQALAVAAALLASERATVQSERIRASGWRCVRDGAPLLHADTDFDHLATCTDLRVVAPA